jgi:hypothetical protein
VNTAPIAFGCLETHSRCANVSRSHTMSLVNGDGLSDSTACHSAVRTCSGKASSAEPRGGVRKSSVIGP